MGISMFDYIPVVSQVKSTCQAVWGDRKGARETQERFSKGCPIVSQCRSLGEVCMGQHEEARKTQEYQAEVLLCVTEATPVVGHMAAGVHLALGNKRAATDAFHRANKTTIIVGTAVPLAIFCPPAAAPAAYGAALAYDGVHSAATQQGQGLVAAVHRVVKLRSNPGEVFDVAAGLALVGASIGVGVAEVLAPPAEGSAPPQTSAPPAQASDADAAAATAAPNAVMAAVAAAGDAAGTSDAASAAAGSGAAELQPLLDKAADAGSSSGADQQNPQDGGGGGGEGAKPTAEQVVIKAGVETVKKLATKVDFAKGAAWGNKKMD